MQIGHRTSGWRAFTLIEIALCLAIIGFALVAIIGALPTGLNVQAQNRQETIINQDASVWIDAIRNGARGYDDLTNYVVAITNRVQEWEVTGTDAKTVGDPDVYVFTYERSTLNGADTTTQIPLVTGANIIGLLTRPQLEWDDETHFRSNYISAVVFAISGLAPEKPPQWRTNMQELSFAYRMIPELVPYVPIDPGWVLTNELAGTDYQQRTNYVRLVDTMKANSFNIRLGFRWPVMLPSGKALGDGFQNFRMMTGGHLVKQEAGDIDYYYLQPSTYEQLK